ncbi:MAG: ABC transporter [Terriglobia bacterium]|nr:MAG: ABC transporter [Terriglobia bacterium]
MITALQAMVRKDVLLFLADPRALLMSIAAPIAIASFFGYALGGSGNRSDAGRISVLVSDLDSSAISREIVTGLSSEKGLEVNAASPAESREAVRKGKAAVAVIIPKDFGSDAGQAFFARAQKPRIDVLYDPSQTAARGMVQGILTGHVMQAVSKEMFTGQAGREVIDQSLRDLEASPALPSTEKNSLLDMLRSIQKWNTSQLNSAAPVQGLSVPFTTREDAVTARQGVVYNGYAHAFAGMAVQFILFLGIDVGIGLLVQRQRGLWKRLRAAPLSRGVLLGSRALSAAVLAFVILLINFVFARIAFGVRVEGSLAGFLAVAAAFALMTATFGLLIAALGKTPEATRGLAIFATLLLVMLGGAWIPSFIFPQWMQKATLIMPTRWAIDGLEAMTWRGLGFTAAIAPLAVLLLFAITFGVLALARFRWEEG